MTDTSWFPLLIQLDKTKEYMVITDTKNLPGIGPFVVVATRIKIL